MLSVIIPSFRDPRLLQAIASVRRFDDVDQAQIIVVDGGSDAALLDEVRKVLGPRDILISEPDEGIFDAMNKGLDAATGDLIGWIGSDDIFSDNVKASEVIEALETADLFVGGTAMVDVNRVTRVFWLWQNPQRAAFFGFHNPHFSTFGHAGKLCSERFDIHSPVSDIDYFLRIFAAKPKVHVDRRITTIMQIGGFSNGSIRKSFSLNAMAYRIYRNHVSAPQAVLATVFKVVPKVVSAVFYKMKRTLIEDELLRKNTS